MNIAILTDTNSGIFPAEGQAHGIHVLPMPVILDGKTYYEGVDLTAEAFYKHLEQGGQVSTSQPAPGDVLSLWEGLLADYDEVVYLPMSSGLSASCRSAIGLAEEFGGKVQVVDNHRISMTLRDAVYDAKALADQGQSAAQIKQALEETAAGEAWTAQVAELFPGCDIQYRPLPFSIGCHIGPGAFGLTVSRRLAR